MKSQIYFTVQKYNAHCYKWDYHCENVHKEFYSFEYLQKPAALKTFIRKILHYWQFCNIVNW